MLSHRIKENTSSSTKQLDAGSPVKGNTPQAQPNSIMYAKQGFVHNCKKQLSKLANASLYSASDLNPKQRSLAKALKKQLQVYADATNHPSQASAVKKSQNILAQYGPFPLKMHRIETLGSSPGPDRTGWLLCQLNKENHIESTRILSFAYEVSPALAYCMGVIPIGNPKNISRIVYKEMPGSLPPPYQYVRQIEGNLRKDRFIIKYKYKGSTASTESQFALGGKWPNEMRILLANTQLFYPGPEPGANVRSLQIGILDGLLTAPLRPFGVDWEEFSEVIRLLAERKNTPEIRFLLVEDRALTELCINHDASTRIVHLEVKQDRQVKHRVRIPLKIYQDFKHLTGDIHRDKYGYDDKRSLAESVLESDFSTLEDGHWIDVGMKRYFQWNNLVDIKRIYNDPHPSVQELLFEIKNFQHLYSPLGISRWQPDNIVRAAQEAVKGSA